MFNGFSGQKSLISCLTIILPKRSRCTAKHSSVTAFRRQVGNNVSTITEFQEKIFTEISWLLRLYIRLPQISSQLALQWKIPYHLPLFLAITSMSTKVALKPKNNRMHESGWENAPLSLMIYSMFAKVGGIARSLYCHLYRMSHWKLQKCRGIKTQEEIQSI